MNKTDGDIEVVCSNKLLLDTHILVWYAEGIKLSKLQVEVIEKARKDSNLFISHISIWEIVMLVNKGRVSFSLPIQEWIDKLLSIEGFSIAELTTSILIESCQLPNYEHKDPVDRMIIATARCCNAVLMTADQKILDYGTIGYVKVSS